MFDILASIKDCNSFQKLYLSLYTNILLAMNLLSLKKESINIKGLLFEMDLLL